MAEELKLYTTWSSPYGLRIVWALKLKGIKFETVIEDISNKSPSLLKYNPVHKKIPILVHNGKPICESLVILEYIEETWKETTPLFPQDPYENAAARFWAKFNDEKLWPSLWQAFVRDGKEQQEAQALAMENLKYIVEQLNGNKFFGGDNIGFLDLVFGRMANHLSILEEVTGQKFIEEEKFPLLKKWMESFRNVSVIKESWPARDRLIIKFTTMVRIMSDTCLATDRVI